MASALAQFPASNQAQMLLPWKVLSVLIENLRVRVEEGGKVYENSDQGCGPQKQSPSGHPVVVSCPLAHHQSAFSFSSLSSAIEQSNKCRAARVFNILQGG